MAPDFLDEIIEERTRRNPAFSSLVAEAEARRKLARRLVALRAAKSLSQTIVAARMGTSASVVSKLEAGGDVRMSTLQRYFAAIGQKFMFPATTQSGSRQPQKRERPARSRAF
jgi:DNA-binding transcriptional regulator YiaG